jgi:hypothetical protein
MELQQKVQANVQESEDMKRGRTSTSKIKCSKKNYGVQIPPMYGRS